MLKAIMRSIVKPNSTQIRDYFGSNIEELTMAQLLFAAWMQWRTGC